MIYFTTYFVSSCYLLESYYKILMFNVKNTIIRAITRIEIAFYTFNNLQFRSFSSTSRDIPTGIFIIYIVKSTSPTTAVFLYLDVKTKEIINYKLYRGQNFYTNFTNFIWKTLLDFKLDPRANNFFLIPKFYINKSLVSRVKDISAFKLEPYTLKTVNYPLIVGEIKNLIKNNLPIELTNIRKLVTNINNQFSSVIPRSKEIQNPINSLSKISTRMYSTSTKKEGPKFQKIKKDQDRSKWREFGEDISFFNPFGGNNPREHDYATIRRLLDEFWVQIVNKKLKGKNSLVLAIQLKIEVTEHKSGNIRFITMGPRSRGFIRSISTIDLVKKNDLNTLKDVYCELWSYKNYNYEPLKVLRVFLWYNFFAEGEYKSRVNSIHLLTKEPSYTPKTLHSLIPKNMDFKSWGSFEYVPYKNLYRVQLSNSNLIADVISQKNLNLVSVYVKNIGGLVLIDSFTDMMLASPNELDSFKRQSDKRILYYIKGSQVFLRETPKKWNFIPQLRVPINKKGEIIEPLNRVITMDIETRRTMYGMQIVCISVCYSDKSVKTFGLWDYKDIVEIVIAAFTSILVKYNDKSSVYFHNLSGFDSNFFFRTLVNMPNIKVSPIFREGKLIYMKLSYNDSPKICSTKNLKSKSRNTFKYSLAIYDSLLLLPASLDKLSKAFKIEQQKGFFPLKYLDNTTLDIPPIIDWSYEGDVPDLKFFYTPHPLHKKEYEAYIVKYQEFKNSFSKDGLIKKWRLKDELVKYCENDVIVLHNLILSFTEHIFDRYKINIQKYPTLPSVAFAIYRSKFLNNSNLIPIITGTIYSDIKHAYYGGFVDTYRPFARHVKSYDVNSLYPSAMFKYPMPVGIPQYFEGNPKYIDDLFGFVFVKVDSPAHLKTPILPVKINKGGGSTTVYPVGTWSGWYFTEELNNAKKYGYKFEILKGYTFQKSNIFKDYVSDLYSIKMSVSSDNPWYIISKILLNSLYGRFGMSPYLDTFQIVNEIELNELLKEDSVYITDLKEFGDKFGVSIRDLKFSQFSLHNVSVPVAAAISAWSRVEMSEYVMKNSDNICCIDTDGIKITSDLPEHQVGKELGKMKLEDEFLEATFIAPKVYGGITTDNKMVIKVKGLKDPLSYWALKGLLYLEHLKISQTKWFKDLSGGNIRIQEEIYTLACTENKRELIRDSFGEFVATAPYKILEGTLLKSENPLLFYLPRFLLEARLLPQPKIIDLNLRITSGVNIIYLPAPIPEIIYLPAPLPKIIYIFPEPHTYMNLLSAPKSYLALPEPNQLLQIAAPLSFGYLRLKAPLEVLNIIYVLPKVFYMEPALPSIIYLPGEIQKCLPAPQSLLALPPPNVNPSAKVLYENPGLPKVIYIYPSLPQIIYLPGKVSVLRNKFQVIGFLLLVLIFIAYFWCVFSAIGSLIFDPSTAENINVIYHQEIDILETEIEFHLPPDSDCSKGSEETSTDLDSWRYLWYKYKYVFLALGLMAFAFWYWINRSGNSSPGERGNNSSIPIRDSSNSSLENTISLNDLPSIRYEDRAFVRRNIRDSFFENIRLSTQLRERNEDLALNSINLNTGSISREEMIQRIHESEVSPNTAIDAVQALLREAAREVNSEIPNISNALVPYNSITDLVVYNPDNIPIPATVDMARYEIFIQFLDHYNAIIASYGV